MTLISTKRTVLREMTVEDAPFILNLLNQPSFVRYIGDRQVRTVDDAATFIDTKYRQSYRDHGYGLYVVSHRDSAAPMGMCGFVRRAGLPCADIGFAFLPQFEGSGYAFEAAAAVLEFGRTTLQLPRVLAIAQQDNVRSHQLLTRLGFERTSLMTMPGDVTPVVVFALDLTADDTPIPQRDDATGYA